VVIRSRIRILDHFSIFFAIVEVVILDLLAFLIYSHRPIFKILGEMTRADIADNRMNPIHSAAIRQTCGSGLIRKSGFESRIRFWPWRSLRSPSAFVITVTMHAFCRALSCGVCRVRNNCDGRPCSLPHRPRRVSEFCLSQPAV